MPTYNVPLGRFIVETYEPVIAGGKLGMNARILFAPNPLATDCKVALIQVVRCTVLATDDKLSSSYDTDGGLEQKFVSSGGWHVDAVGRATPAFGLKLANGNRVGSVEAQWRATESDP